jgi:glycosyltransferase involved in cell wall biosynthesis
MRLLLVVSSLGPGGTERVVATLAGAWAARGHGVTIATLSDAAAAPFYGLHPAVGHLPLGVARDSAHLPAALANNVRTVRALRRLFAGRRPDVVVSFGDTTNVACLAAAAGLRIPVVVAERCDPRLTPANPAWRALRRAAYPLAATVVAQTQAAASWFRAGGVRRVAVIPNPVALPVRAGAAADPWPGGAPLLLGVGRLVAQKGFDLLVGAFARVAPGFPDWRLLILGEGPERARLESLAARPGLAERVRLPGVSADPAPAYRRASLFALPSRFEGFPNALVEAMACGLPVVAADCPSGPAEIVRHGVDGLLVPAGDEAALAAALARLMADPGARRALGDAARGVTERFSLERVLGLWDAVLPGPSER